MKYSTIDRCEAWIYWVRKEKAPTDYDEGYESRLLMIQDLQKLIDVVKAAQSIDYNRYPELREMLGKLEDL